MDKNTKADTELVPPDASFNNGFTAIPKDAASADDVAADADLVATSMDFGEMNDKDAKDSGYTDKDGKAVSMAKGDVEGSPTGAYTDIGAGRSSVVHKNPGHKH
jgi:hypothetical protein